MSTSIPSSSADRQHGTRSDLEFGWRAMPRWLAVAALAGVLFFTRLGTPKLWDRDEPRNARCAWEMFERNDWVVPTFNGELRSHKPILLYWIMMSAYHVGGVNEWTARAGSAILSVGTVLLTYGIGRRLFGASTAQWAALVLSTTLMFNVAAHAATPDACLIFCCTLALYAWVRGTPATLWSETNSDASSSTADTQRITCESLPIESGQVALKWTLLACCALGLGVLAKGPVGFVLPLAVWGVFIGWTGLQVRSSTSAFDETWLQGIARRLHPRHIGRSLLLLRPLLAILIAGLIAAPWYLLVGQQTNGVWLREFFLEHNVGRAMRTMEGHQGNPLLYYPIAILVGCFPWSVFAMPIAIWTWRRRYHRSQSQSQLPNSHVFLLAWIGVMIGAFSCASTKLPSYVTPTYPAIALLCGDFFAAWQQRRWALSIHWPRRAAITLTGLGLALCIGLPVAAHFLLPGEAWLGLVGLIPMMGGAWMWRHFNNDRIDAGFRAAGVTAILLSLSIWGLVVPQVSRHQQIAGLLDALRNDRASNPTAVPVASIGVHEPSWIYYAGRTIPLLDPSATRRASQILSSPGGQLIISDSLYQQIATQLPSDLHVRSQVPYFLKDEKLLLLERTPRQASQVPSAMSPASR